MYYVIAPDDDEPQEFKTIQEAEEYVTRYLDESYATLEEWIVIKGERLTIKPNSITIIDSIAIIDSR